MISLVIFQYTVEIREPWFGQLSYNNNHTIDHHEWLTGSTIKFAKNWYNEGPLNLKFAMLDNPKSVEFQNISFRALYTSYPPGTILPIYAASELLGQEPSPSIVMGYDLINHFFISFLLGLLIFLFLRKQLRFDVINSFLFSIIPVILELLLPGPLYWFQNVFFSDQAVILPFVLFIFFEEVKDGIKMDTTKNSRNLTVLNIFQNIVLFYGFLTDWLFVFIALTIYIKRLLDGEIFFTKKMFWNRDLYHFITDSLKYWFSPIVAVSLFVLQVILIGGMTETISRALLRTSISNSGTITPLNELIRILGHVTNNYGNVGKILIFVSLLFFMFMFIYLSFGGSKSHKNIFKIKKTIYLMGMLLVPCILQLIVFSNHSYIHEFSVLKLSIPLATIPFVLLPITIFLFVEEYVNKKIKMYNRFKVHISLFLLIIFLISFSAASIYTIDEHPHYKAMFPPINDSFVILGTSIEKNTGYNDIVFSPDFKIPENPPQLLSYSMKRVYLVNSTAEIENDVAGLNTSYNIVIVFLNPPNGYWKKIVGNTTPIIDKNIYYYRFNSKNFSKIQ
jgi:hypothetical protein